MTIRPLLKLGDPLLLSRSEPVTEPGSPEIAGLIQDMKDTLEHAQGAGLAAPQIGVLKRVILISVPEERIAQDKDAKPLPVTALINPCLTPEDLSHQDSDPEAKSNHSQGNQTMEEGWEGCLSIPGLVGVVPRYRSVHYQAIDPTGTPLSGRATGFHARVLQHEWDHLEGIVYPMRMRDLGRLSFTDQIDKHLATGDTARLDSAGLASICHRLSSHRQSDPSLSGALETPEKTSGQKYSP